MPHSVKICRNPDVKKNGCSQLWLRVIIDRKIKHYPTGHEIEPKYWDDHKNIVRGTYPLSIKMQNSLDKIFFAAKNAFMQLIDSGQDINFESFENIFIKGNETYDFIVLSKAWVNDNKHKFAAETLRLYGTEIKKMQEFLPVIHTKDINLKFYMDYEKWLYEKGNSCNTVGKALKHVRKLENGLVLTGKMKKSNSNLYKIKSVPSGREYLTLDEVISLEEYYTNKCKIKPLQNALKCFLFACYTGLRYKNIEKLKFEDINNNSIIIADVDAVKNKEIISIPLTKPAKKYLPAEINYDNNTGNKTKVFHVISNQKMNEYLKLVADGAELKKKLHFHIARHTFATISLNIGIPLEVVQRLLGHRSIKTTQIYAKIMDKTKFAEMDKWNKL